MNEIPTILLVDDTPQNLKVLMDLLREQHYDLMVANSGERAITLLEKAQPDLILMDVMMPGIDGYEACQRIKSNLKTTDIPVLFITAKGDDARIDAFKAGGFDYIPKPFNSEEVLARVHTHVKLYRLAQKQQQMLKAMEVTVSKQNIFFSSLTNELKIPVTSIMGYSEMVMDCIDDQVICNDILKIMESSNDLLKLVNDILDLSRLESNQMRFDKEEFHLQSFLEDIKNQIKPQLKKNNNQITIELNDNSLEIESDLIRLHQVLTNLILVSSLYTRNGNIVLKVFKQNEKIIFQLEDTGFVLAKDEMEKLFNSYANNISGSGLELHLTKKICYHLGGNIHVKTTEVGNQFIVELPERSSNLSI